MLTGTGHETLMALGENILKAERLLDGEDPEDVLGGRKVRSFWRNIYAPSNSLDVTIDSWMLKLLAPEAKSYNWLARKGVYDALADGVRDAAEALGCRPHELQAALWIHARGTGE
jgi:hypothetical protein